MTSFLTVQNSYQDIELALCRDAQIVDSLCASKNDASKLFIPLVQQLITRNSISLSQLQFIAANVGPGPFTTLRTVLASANGLSFATNTPLIGINALDAMVHENQINLPLVVLLNAFGNDVYFAIRDAQSTIQKGCMEINALLAHIAATMPEDSIQFTGNGASLHKDLIQNAFGPRAHMAEPIPQTPSIGTIAALGLEKWNTKEGLANQLLPVYLK
jgi:tRNA threonylcarbamoyladenosine biosynthesis protein TsaB